MSARTKLLLLQLLVVIPVCAFFFFFALGAFGLVGADEPRYAQIGREMLSRRDWVVPTLNGQPWLEKPVLLYWGEMAAYSIFGVHDWAARIPSATFAAGLVIVILFFMRRFRPGSELDAALIAASCAAMIGFSRGASTDMQLCAPFCAAMLAWWAWHETGRKLWLGWFYGLLAIGALAKGPVSPGLAVIIVAAYAWLRRNGRIFVRSLWLPGFAIFFAIVLPWYVAVQIKVPQFFRTFFLQHNLERFSTNLYQHSQPFWYYIPVFLVAMLPWVAFTLPALWHAIRNAWFAICSTREGTPAEQSAQDGLLQFLLLWVLIPIVFFSISRSKLPGYILPAIPAAALLTAAYLHDLGKAARVQLILHALICGAILGGALLAPWLMLKVHVTQELGTWLATVTAVTASAVLLLVRYRGLRVLHFITLVPLVLGLVFLLRFAVIPQRAGNPVHGAIIDLTQSARPVDAELRGLGVNSGPIAIFNVRHQRELQYGLNFYRNQAIELYGQDPIPGEAHVVIAQEGDMDAVQASLGQRKITSIGVFPPQRLQFFRVSK
ncbi:MAG TPA: glycosyltransferase family 39 protein [Candidatus Angelobacter sp.]|nr:glycosyltransferase family 39 protein [Candidatus Angelobacter sp.]